MAQVVMLKAFTASYTDNYDVIEIQEDDVELSGPGYTDLHVIKLPAFTKKELVALFNTKIPAIRLVNEVTLECETSPGVWEEIKQTPKYSVNLSAISIAEWASITSALTPKATAEAIISAKSESCILRQIDELKPIAIIKKQ